MFFLAVLSAMVMLLGLTPFGRISAGAATADKIRIYSRFLEYYTIKLPYAGDTVKNVKSSSKKMVVRLAELSDAYNPEDSSQNENMAWIGIYGKKTGVYTFSYDIYKKNGKKRSHKQVKVYVKDDSPIKSLTFAGKETNRYFKAKSGKLVVKLAPGYTLKKIEIGKYKRVKTNGDGYKSVDTQLVYTTVKNGSVINLEKKAYYYIYSQNDGKPEYSSYSSIGTTGDTEIRITYIDKYTKKKTTCSEYIQRLAFF